VASLILGGNDFINEIKDKYIRKADRNLPSLRHLFRGPSIEGITKETERVFEEDPILVLNCISKRYCLSFQT
jgi:hypothetical protein